MTNQEKIKRYFENETTRSVVSIRKIETLVGLPESKLSRFIRGVPSRLLTDQEAEKILNIIEEISIHG